MDESSRGRDDFRIERCYLATVRDHIAQASGWLDASNEGENTRAISYAALELRHAIELLAVRYVHDLQQRPLSANDLVLMASFKRMENKIYELAGHQRRIDSDFEFIRIVMSEMKLGDLKTPELGVLSKSWHACSAYLHIAWPLTSKVRELAVRAFQELRSVRDELTLYASSPGWAILQVAEFSELRDRFFQGDATREDVVAYVRRVGIYAVLDPGAGAEPRFVGTPVPPGSQAL